MFLAEVAMQIARILAFALLAVTLSAGAQADEMPGSGQIVIQLSRSRCFGSCPDYQVSIRGDGQVDYDGRHYVAVTGHASRRIAPKRVRELYRRFLRANFFQFANDYTSRISDIPTVELSVFDGEHWKHVRDHAGHLGDMPAVVTELEDLVDDVAGTSEWVKGANSR